MNTNIIDRLNSVETQRTALKERFGLEFNPFPRSGIAIISESDKVAEQLMPVDDETINKIFNFISDALYAHRGQAEMPDKYMSMVVRGDYGSGKTQTLMFIRYLLKNLKNEDVKPYVVYIDNPGQKLAELIGVIVSQIGVENFKKYLWGIFMEYLDKNPDVKQSLVGTPQVSQSLSLFDEDTPVPSLSNNIQNYKELADAITAGKNATEKKQLLKTVRDHMIKSYAEVTDSSQVVASYFYDIVSETIGVSKSWDMLTSGGVKEMDKREVYILKAIVNIVCKQLGYTDFFILIDEFEEITAERLKRTDIDNYLRNLRLLIDREKNWCSVFAMTGKAMDIIESYSPPLAGRIKGIVVDLKPLNIDSFRQVVNNYLNISRKGGNTDSIEPFDESGLDEMLQVKNPQLKGSPRFLLKMCYQLLQRAATDLSDGEKIDRAFVKRYIDDFLK
ncbi:MAG: hypothetical protein IJK75_00630 [Bacteroidales bacterium]|nr:hypothetical protein [Bacteroidales bacterium]